MDLNLKGKVALVTGSSRGIGFEIAKAFIAEGCRVVISGTDSNRLENAKDELQRIGECLAILCDVTRPEAVEKMIMQTEKYFGSIDILVNNVGALRACLIKDMDEATWDFALNVNLKSTFLCSKYVYPIMQKNNGGVIINAASYAALIPSVGHGAYGAAKAAVINLTKTCAAEFAPGNVRVNAYLPGVVSTHLTEKMREDHVKANKLLNDIPIKKFALASEVASVVVFIASDKAGYMTGSIVDIHGGKLCVQNPDDAYN